MQRPDCGLLYGILRQCGDHPRREWLHCDRPGFVLCSRPRTRTPTATSSTTRPTTAFGPYLSALFGFRYENERGSYVEPPPYPRRRDRSSAPTSSTRCSCRATSRAASSTRPAARWRRTISTASPELRASACPMLRFAPARSGSTARCCARTSPPACRSRRSPSQFASLYTQLQQAGDTADIAKYHIMPPGPQRLAHLRRRHRPEHPRREVGLQSWITSTTPSTIRLKESTRAPWSRYFGYPPSVADNLLRVAVPQLAGVPRAGARSGDRSTGRSPALRAWRLHLPRRGRDPVVLQRRLLSPAATTNQSQPSRHPHRSGRPIDRRASLPASAAHRLLRRAIHRAAS